MTISNYFQEQQMNIPTMFDKFWCNYMTPEWHSIWRTANFWTTAFINLVTSFVRGDFKFEHARLKPYHDFNIPQLGEDSGLFWFWRSVPNFANVGSPLTKKVREAQLQTIDRLTNDKVFDLETVKERLVEPNLSLLQRLKGDYKVDWRTWQADWMCRSEGETRLYGQTN